MHVDQSSLRLKQVDTRASNFHTIDPFTPTKRFWPSFLNALLATALFRCYHVIFFFTGWATLVSLINSQKVYALNFKPTLLTVVGTVIGFVISYRTTSSFERYNEGRRLWSQIILQSRTFARTVWLHVPDVPPTYPENQGRSDEEAMARSLIEKKTVVNLIEAFGVSVKHYLRGEEGCYYEDLYPLVKYLPSYALPLSIPSPTVAIVGESGVAGDVEATLTFSEALKHSSATHLPLYNVSSVKEQHSPNPRSTLSPPAGRVAGNFPSPPLPSRRSNAPMEEQNLLPSRLPPKLSYFDVFPFSLFVKFLTKKGNTVKGRKAARLRAKLNHGKRGKVVNHNVPLEITFYLSSYIAALQRRKSIDVPTTNLLTASLNGLVDALTGLERILTTPIPFSYSIHLWTVTTLYCLALPLQIWDTMGWLTIPSTSILSFVFFGFLTAGEEIENPFGYDKNDLNMDHFTHSIIRTELMAITSLPPPEPSDWAFSSLNDLVFDVHNLPVDGNISKVVERASPDEWIARGSVQIRDALARVVERAHIHTAY